MTLTEHQSDALDRASGPIALLTSPPGCGKTFTAAQRIKDLMMSQGHLGIAVAAPTGKAARRMTESLRGHGLNINATTIHRLLAYSYINGHGEFAHNRRNPLPYSHVFIDESSMADVSLMASLLAARRRGSQFLFIGDPNQLPPVGHGAPLRDFIDMHLPHGKLTEIHRNAGRIVRCCKSIVEQQMFESSRSLEIEDGENLFVDSQWKGTDGQVERLRYWLREDSPLFSQFGCDAPIDLVWDVQVICPLNAKSNVSRAALNKVLQGYLNPTGKQVKGKLFRVDDKVVCRKNGWYLAARDCPSKEINADGRVYCANGEQAKVIEVDERWTVVELSLPKRLVRIGKTKGSEEDAVGVWELSFCISAHLAQGAEWPFVIVIGDESKSASWLCDRHWLLTAISRAETACVCIANESTLQDWTRKSHLYRRKTWAVQKYFELLVAK